MSTLYLIHTANGYMAVDRSSYLEQSGVKGMKWGMHIYGDDDYTPVGKPAQTPEEEKALAKQNKRIDRANKAFDRNRYYKTTKSANERATKQYQSIANKYNGKSDSNGSTIMSNRDYKKLESSAKRIVGTQLQLDTYNQERKKTIDLIRDPDDAKLQDKKQELSKATRNSVISSAIVTSIGAVALATTGFGIFSVPRSDAHIYADVAANNAKKTYKLSKNALDIKINKLLNP